MCNRKKYWNTYIKTLNNVNDDMKKEMDIVTLVRRIRAHGFALSMLFDPKTLKMISNKASRKPQAPLPETEGEGEKGEDNLWCTYSMFTEAEKRAIDEMEAINFGHADGTPKPKYGPHN